MGFRMNYLFIGCLVASIYSSNGCTMEGVTTWQLPITVRIEDYHDGIVLQRTVTDIGGFTLTSSSDLNQGPYIVASIENSAFVLRTNDAYRLFEEHETADLISLTYAFTCTNGQTPSSPLTIRIEINDNNNNPPLWKTPDTVASETTAYDFTIATPVPPGFLITNCVSDIIVRDIDLTTYRIDFSIEDNPYIGIEYDEAALTDAKEFKAVLKSTAFIRSIPEPIILTISATDVDQTGDPPITRSTTVTIHGSSDFELPLEPIFSQAFYLASYTENNQVTVEQSITLEQGYDELVQFSLEGDYAADHFTITVNGNLVTLSVTNALPAAALQEGRIYLVVHASREYTSGASATIIIELPEVEHLEFERPHYEGEIVDNTLQLTPLVLSQGYQGSDVTVTVEDYSSFFSYAVVGNTITLSMTPLDDNIIQENNYINLRVTASTGYSSATTIVTLEIVKDDVTTPVFDQSLYTGTYDPAAGLAVEPILLARGYDETVTVTLSGEYESYFELTQDGPSLTLRVVGDGLPSHILSQTHLHLSVEATKPRTVGASAVVAITLPGAREMHFEAQSYKGAIQDNILTLDTIILSVGYEEDVTFSLSGDYSTSFAVSNVQNQVTINMPAQLPQEVISENNFVMLTLSAEGLNALPTTTAVLLEIIKVDATTPVFSQPIYDGTYFGSLGIVLENINLIQGYDSSVTFRIQGENSEYFSITQNLNSVTLTVQSSIPEEVIFQEKTFVFNIFAEKPLTVGANAAIVVRFSEDYAASFTHTVTANTVTVSMTSELPAEVLENNRFIILELEARRDRAMSVVAGIVIEIVETEIIAPVFSQAYYSGMYTEENALQFQDTITLIQGFDETVTFGLEGESAAWFGVEWNGNSVTVVSTAPLPQDVLDSQHQLLFGVIAYKPNSINGRAAISIELPKDLLEQEVLRFAQSSYEGQLDGSQLQVPTITLSNEITENVIVSLSGAYATYFTVTLDSNTVHIELVNELPSEVITNNEFIVLDIIASKTDAVSGYTALVLSIVKEPIIVTPVFDQAYYTGEISEQGELLFEHTMRLIQGFDESVTFTLSGDGSERFILTQTGQNSLSLSISQGELEGIENISHFVFSVVASKAGSVSGQAAIVIHNTDSSTARTISFSRNHYTGSLEDNVLTMEAISIVEGYGSDVYLTLSGDYVEYFQLVGQDGTYTLQLISNVPNEIIEARTMLVYTLEANGDTGRAHTTVIVELVKSNEVIEALSFDEAYYLGSYSATTGVMADIQLRIVTGYDSEIVLTVQGENSAWFIVQHSESVVTISLAAPLPIELFIDNQPVIFAINAVNSGGSTALATIVVSLEGELSELTVLGFERSSYLGTIESDTSTLQPIILTQGYSSEVYFTLQGDLSNYFTINQQGSSVNIVLQSTIPTSELPANGIIVLELQATAVQAVSATTTIVFEVADGEDLSFSAAYYIGQYIETEGLIFDTISLDVGYDQDVQFSLEGENAQWFALQVQGNAVTLIMTSAIPPAILADNHQLVFSVTALKPRSNIATATIVISLIDESTVVTILSFEQTSYLGSIANDALSIEPIVLNEGYTEAVSFTLSGDLASYFNLQQQGSTINIILQSALPEQTLPANGIVLLDLRASAPLAITATTTVVIDTQRTFYVEELAFSAAYYVGEYSETSGFTFDSIISLDVGYDQNVQFILEGEHSQWFALEVQGNAVTLTMSGAIPSAILVNNHHLAFIVTAQKPNSNIATATIIISLVDDYTDAIVLGFERAHYLGSIENDALTMEPIVLNEGYTDAVTFTLSGDLASYFNLQHQGSTINIVLQSAIPEETIPANGILLLELRASAPQAITATTTVVIEAQKAADLEQLAFSDAYYIGEYSETSGLAFDSVIALDIGYDQNVQFALEGEHSQWFALEVQGNAVTLTMSGAIPPAILVNNHQLIFIVTAQKANSNIATATIIISLIDDYTDAIILGFERANYLGSIENDVLTIEPIVLSEGYTDAVTFTLSGDLASYFNLQQQGSTVNIVLQGAIPEETIPVNGILLLELRASAPQAITATTTVVIEAQKAANLEQLAFSEAYYIGEYSENSGLAFDSIIALDVGYDQNVQFALEGEHSQWFALEVQDNAVTLTMSGAIPPAILVNNHQLVFIVTAQKSSSNIATATIIISLIDDYTDAIILGFERANYFGSIENDALTIEPIILNEGYTDAVTFTLSGDLASYFNLQQQESTVNIVLQSAIPEETIPANGILLLELRASAPQAIAATTTVVIEAQQAADIVELAFSAAYYIGEYSESSGLAFDSIIALDVGYDENVQFALEGEHSQWFALEVQDNTVTLTMSGAIPPAILVNNHQLVFIVNAQKASGNIATATIIISLIYDYTEAIILGFERANYLGSIENDVLTIEPIVLIEGYTDAVTFTLSGDLASYFNLQHQGFTVNIVLQSTIPEETIPTNGILLLELRASAPQAIAATTTVVIEAQPTADVEELTFSATYYIGEYSETSGLAFDSIIALDVGYDQNVQFSLEGEHAQWFSLEVQGNAAALVMTGAIPPAILVNNHQLVFRVTAQKPNSNIATATIVVSLVDDYTDATILGFEQASYFGSIENNVLIIEQIVLNEGYTDAVTFSLSGDLASYFNLQQQDATINIVLQSTIPEQALPTNGIILLNLRASALQSVPGTTTIVIEAQRAAVLEELAFSSAYYVGEYSETSGLAFGATISLDVGYDQNIQFTLEGDHAQWFALQIEGNAATLTLYNSIPSAVLVNNHQLIFSVTAQKPNSIIAISTVVISLIDDYTDATILGFERASYLGSIENSSLIIEPINLSEGYSDAVTFALSGDLASYFNLQQQGAIVNIVLQSTIPEQALPANGILLLELQASATQSVSATTTIVIEVQRAAVVEELAFSAAYYTGEYSETSGLTFENAISLDAGYGQDVSFTLEGDNAQWFGLSVNGNSITLVVVEPIPSAILIDLRKIIMIVTAAKSETTASTIIIISIIDDSGSVINEAFDKVLYEGTINNNVVQHEPITITGHASGIDIEILGVYRELFSASVSGDTVLIGAAGTLNLPEGVSHVALEFRAGSASAVVIFNVIQSETPELPTVAFESPSYVLRADMAQTGLLGLVQATASNGESITYSLAVDDAHLRERVLINSVGEIHLSAPTNTGVYSFQAIATSSITQVQATTAVQLTVEAVAICGDEHVLPPLIILDRDEEEPHTNLVVLDSEAQADCQFRLTNRWPLDQDWLYVDNTGLHARAIDREDPRIAFMALSQVQVELVLECASDTQSRAKRSTLNPRLDWLGPYEYGSNRWILTDTILYNSRRSFVNLIVNDINDNYPIFVGNENEPIICGYPIPELEDIVLPRALAELKATDADVGENAALSFWSASEVLAVASTTGFVHLRDGASLSQDQRLIVSVTDLNGREDGLTTSIELLVKLLDTSHIAVVTVRNAFLDQEETILENLSSAVGYEVKVLSSAVISDDPSDSANTRRKREVTTEGASLQLYVYGLIDREPVAVDRLTNDITDNIITGVDVTSTVSLEDYLEGREIYGGGRDTGLLVATIVLSILLFILMLLIALWFFLRWRKSRNYEQFSDANSLASRDEPLESPQKIDSLRKPRLNIDELKRSERRLQEMLDAPVEEVKPKAQTSQVDPKDSVDTVINMASTRATDVTLPIVIQSIDKLKDDEHSGEEDEFGERKNKSRRKSVVTFNENVEKIIHVEDIPDDNSSDLEIYKF
ncbi:uncharacterized protein LOC133520038 isoform X2 [Cydia pomonella]|uniref:uncharacterized protein LOC133520038 isoform X2 n=1 Tax=Cydia pomonella TaxID=82600 RepID=UPI002ADE41B5|nr:uncharacterized protein LOC133520038 isoform X2 [Cydia pomonella]